MPRGKGEVRVHEGSPRAVSFDLDVPRAGCAAQQLRVGPYTASARAHEDQRLQGLIKHAWLESGSVYGHCKVAKDLRDWGETCTVIAYIDS